MPIGINRSIQTEIADKPSINLLFPSLLVLVSAVSVILFLRKKQLAYSIQSHASNITSHFSTKPEEQKILQIDQKMDGTVVLNFQGKEHKLCKPELDSESDQFIGRLLSLSHADVKEIDYDNSVDEHLRVTAPLSKLVTRLGFVGIKRDLFFPRTSKNRVLFRRYITEDDLASMNIQTTQLVQELSN